MTANISNLQEEWFHHSRVFFIQNGWARIITRLMGLVVSRIRIYIFAYSLFDIGAIYSVVSMLACVAPKMTFQLYGFIPVPAWLAITGIFTYDLYSTMSNTVSKFRSIYFLIIGYLPQY